MDTEAGPRKLRWFQMNLRDLLAIVMIAAIGLAWWNDHQRLSEVTRRLQDDLGKQSARNDQLLAHVSTYRHVINTAGLAVDPSTPFVTGLATKISSDPGTVEINIGANDGLQPGQVLDVYHLGKTLDSTKYHGQIRLTSVENTSALGEILSSVGGIEVNDCVAARVK